MYALHTHTHSKTQCIPNFNLTVGYIATDLLFLVIYVFVETGMRVGAVSMAAFMEDDDEVEDPYSAIPDILKPTAQKEDDGKNRLETPLAPTLARVPLYSLPPAFSTHN